LVLKTGPRLVSDRPGDFGARRKGLTQVSHYHPGVRVGARTIGRVTAPGSERSLGSSLYSSTAGREKEDASVTTSRAAPGARGRGAGELGGGAARATSATDREEVQEVGDSSDCELFLQLRGHPILAFGLVGCRCRSTSLLRVFLAPSSPAPTRRYPDVLGHILSASRASSVQPSTGNCAALSMLH
jgi:hypothetical protein